MRRSQVGAPAMVVALLAATAVVAAVSPPVPAGGGEVEVVVRGLPGRSADVVAAVAAAGGEVERRLPIIDGVAATVPAAALPGLGVADGVAAVSGESRLELHGVEPSLGYDPVADLGSLHDVARIIGAHDSWKAGYTGKGIDIAMIDTGVSPVQGLTSGNVVHGPDLSFDSQDPERTHRDGYGHGTHLASIMVGRDAVGSGVAYARPSTFTGIAPDARLVSVKVGASDGAADVSQVIAAIDWVVANARRDGMNIRVLSLAFGTDATQDHRIDPLSYAAEVAWRAGIVVVVSGGNDGTDRKVLANPARHPVLLAAGASDPQGTLEPTDDIVPDFATRGEASRHVDVVAPGVHVLGLRAPGSVIDEAHPESRVGTRFLRGSGTSQAAAVTAGAVALLLQRHPTASPERVKRLLMYTATPLKAVPTLYRGNGSLDVRRAQVARLDQRVDATPTPGAGTGSLEEARGTSHVAELGVELQGERDIFGVAWDGARWAPEAHAQSSWDRGTWNGSAWTGTAWAGTSWAGWAWTGTSWTGRTWTGRTWTAEQWAGDGAADGDDWSGRTWTGRTWTGSAWATGEWR